MQRIKIVGEIPNSIMRIIYQLKFFMNNLIDYIMNFDDWNSICFLAFIILIFILVKKYKKNRKIDKVLMVFCIVVLGMGICFSINPADTCKVEYLEVSTSYGDNGTRVNNYVHYDYKIKEGESSGIGEAINITNDYIEIQYMDNVSMLYSEDTQSVTSKISYDIWIRDLKEVVYESNGTTYRLYRYSK